MARTCQFAAHLGNFALLTLNVFFSLGPHDQPLVDFRRLRLGVLVRNAPTSDLNAVRLEPGDGPGKLRLAVNSGTSCELGVRPT